MKGYRTIVVNGVALLASLAVLAGVEIGVDEQSAIVLTIMTAINIGLRKVTTTPLGEDR